MRVIELNVGDDMEQLRHSNIHAGGGVIGMSFRKPLRQCQLKLNTRQPSDLAIPLLYKYSRKRSTHILPTHENNNN